MGGGGFEGEEDVYRSLLDNGAIEQVKEITLLAVWIYEKKAVSRELVDMEMGIKMIFKKQQDTISGAGETLL